MQESISLIDILNELREIKKRIERIEDAIEDLADSILTPDEQELIRKHKEAIKKGDFSDFIPIEKLDEVLK
ncbi:MAG: hypothetical protein QFX40_01105 [Archaeoglobales archaeon]|nr:hypothetical protein [Archaeoglobales archaeon]